MMFAFITPAIITGSVAGRMKFQTLFFFIALVNPCIYPLAHTWHVVIVGEIGVLDFAVGNVIHISSGTTGLILAVLLGKRVDYATDFIPHT
nr:ammonium transporter [Candidatus Endomicrobium trichonymphae]